jgi:hypothetical protein
MANGGRFASLQGIAIERFSSTRRACLLSRRAEPVPCVAIAGGAGRSVTLPSVYVCAVAVGSSVCEGGKRHLGEVSGAACREGFH